jgi:hypothetical protein
MQVTLVRMASELPQGHRLVDSQRSRTTALARHDKAGDSSSRSSLYFLYWYKKVRILADC